MHRFIHQKQRQKKKKGSDKEYFLLNIFNYMKIKL